MTDPMSEQRFRASRRVLRWVGPPLLLVGLVCIAVGIISTLTGPPRPGSMGLVWVAILGMPIAFVGGAMTLFGFAGELARFQGRSMGPAVSATFNDIAEDSAPGVRAIAGAVRDGVARGADASETDTVRCPACAFANDADARFCAGCGGVLEAKACGSCGHPAKADARFCDECGAGLDT